MAQSLAGERSMLKALESSNTCTNETLLNITSILLPDLAVRDGVHDKENGRSHGRAKSVAVTAKVTKVALRRTKAHARQLTVVEVKADPVPNEADKVNFAFQVVNSCIKILSQLAKQCALAKRAGREDGNETQRKNTTRTVPAKIALRPKSPNARRHKAVDEAATPCSDPGSSGRTVAACAFASLSFLQRHYQVAGGKDKNYQVENGTLAVVGKCIDLELADLALEQLQVLKRRLLTYLPGNIENQVIKNRATDVFLDLLSFPKEMKVIPAIQFVVKIQQQVWQLAHLQASTVVPEALASSEHVHCSALREFASTMEEPAKASRLLGAMSRLLLHLSTMSGLSLVSITILRCSAFHLQAEAAEFLTGLSDEEAGSVSAKLRRCIESLLKSSKIARDGQIESVRTTVSLLVQTLIPYPSCAEDISHIKEMSNRLAIKTGSADDVLKQSKAVLVSTTCSPSEILHAATDSLSVTNLENAVLALQQPLPEDRVAADRLLVDTAGFRRALHKSVSDQRITGAQSFVAAAACLSLLRQYLGCSLDRRKDQRKVLEDRLRVGKKFVKPFISTLIVCCLHHEEPTADMFCALKTSCAMFLEVIEQDGTFAVERFGNSSDPHSSIFITISKLCYKTWNTRASLHGATDDLALIALDTSIKVMVPWTVAEREVAAVTQRFRFLMNAQIAKAQWYEASRTFERFLHECKSSGYLAELATGAASKPLNVLRTSGTIGALVFRCTQMWTTVMRKMTLGDNQVTLSTFELGVAEQGLLLEWQFELLCAYVSQERAMDHACVPLLQLTHRWLLQVYDEKSFPIRRLRVAATAARLLCSVPELCDSQSIASELSTSLRGKSLGLDFELVDHIGFLQANAQATLALLDPHGDETTGTLLNALDDYKTTFASINDADDAMKTVGDVSLCIDHFEAIADFYAFRRDVRLEVQTLEIILRLLMKLPGLVEQQASLLCRLADAHLLVGYTEKAFDVLELCETKIKAESCTIATHIRYLLSRATYLLAVSQHENCKEILQLVAHRAQVGGEQSFIRKTFTPSASLCIPERRLVARAAYLNAELEFQTRCIPAATRYCSIAKCMLFKIWTSVEQIMPRDIATSTTIPLSSCPSSDAPLAIDDVQPVVVTRSYSHLDTPKLRMVVPELLQVAMLEIKLHQFRGSYHDAFGALKHVNKIANHVGAGAAGLSDLSAAELYIRSLPLNHLTTWEQKIQDARARIDMVDEAFLYATKTLDVFAFEQVKAHVLAAEQEPEEQLATLDAGMKLLQGHLQAAEIDLALPGARNSKASIDALTEDLACMALEKSQRSKQATRYKPTTRKTTKVTKTTKKPVAAKPAKTQPQESHDRVHSVPLLKWHATLLRESLIAALLYRAKPDLGDLARLVEAAGKLVYDAAGAIDQSITHARLLAHQVAGEMASDINFNALQDCILSVPAPQKHANAVQEPTVSLAKTVLKKSKAAKSVSKPQYIAEPAFYSTLQTALEALRHTWKESCLMSSSATLRRHGHLMSSISATASACLSAGSDKITHPLVLAYHNDYPAIRSRLLDRQAEHPAVEKLNKDDLRQWPSISLEIPLLQETGAMDRAAFQEEYIDIIPEAWTTVSMSLTEDKTAMKLIRYRSGQSPLCLRIPFAYRESDDPDEEVLDMSLAYQRLRSIIKQHEFSPAEARNTNQADFKKQWWLKKHELDTELRSLLCDVEDQWFVAVKGVFSSGQCDGQALSNFQAQLQSILCLHCPTKKTKGKAKTSVESLDLEPRILELFAGLGDPDSEVEVGGEDGFVTISLAESPTLSDGIHELVRLVLEGLQFAGESIAIDEVDMDNVIVKVIDALRVYHGSGISARNDASHTILILDNQLHGFPWESLPCLRHKSVSRLPSLADLRDRIVAARVGCHDGGMIGKTISRVSGVSLLNPSGDLTKTAQRFQPWLPKLPPSWVHLRQSPDDDGWRDLLSENDLFLYVGHGSTSQYVRPRVVKRLGYAELSEVSKSTCAVSWLVGCGSVAVEDLGEFEPSGMVLNYLAAGSPAVLGALWDVGDIDADHFSITAADYWGLWDESNKGLDPKSFPGRKRILDEKRALGRSMSMCEAVARSRDGCKLPYLNGAAFVVYGIPVFLV